MKPTTSEGTGFEKHRNLSVAWAEDVRARVLNAEMIRRPIVSTVSVKWRQASDLLRVEACFDFIQGGLRR